MARCEVSACNEEATVAGLCSACYAGIRYWTTGKTPGQIVKRRKQLDRLEARMDLLQGNVKILKRQAG